MDSSKLIKIIIGVLIVVIVLRMLSCKRGMMTGPENYADLLDDSYLENFADYDPLEMGQTEEGFAPSAIPDSKTPMATSVDLLPKPVAGSTDYGEFAPKNLGSINFVDSKQFIGTDTQGSSLKNANYSIRRDPVIPKVDVGPWSQSTYEADLYRKPLDC